MKRLSIYKSLFVLATATLLIAGCTKEQTDVRLDPSLATANLSGITSESATIQGFVISQGGGFTEKGVCYSTASNPTTADSKVVYDGESEKAAFSVTLTGLDYATTYYARAYGISSSGTAYGELISFTTLPVLPTVTTVEITGITGNSATGGGTVTLSGGADITARGVCWSTSPNPEVSGDHTSDDTGTGAFESALTGLLGNIEYYVRAYATNSVGTAYGPQVSFTTLVDVPVVTTTAVTDITKTSASSGGNVTYDGGGEVTDRGLVWGLTENPVVETDNVIAGGSGLGEFTSLLEGLDIFTTYHVRAFAVNSAGTVYGDDIQFTTQADITKFWVVGSYNSWDNSDNALYIESTATNSEAQGYVYFPASGAFKLTTDHSWDDAHTYGDDGSGNLTNPGNDITAPAGYLFIKANLADMSYSVTATAWGVVGSATPDGWNYDTPLTYDQDLLVWRGGVALVAGAFKFRANDDWAYNYGADAGDPNLVAGGSDISITVDGDYAITLDLSNPNAYTYSANRWGIVGSATGSWDVDQKMTWDDVNGVFTVTLDLVAGVFKYRANEAWAINLGGDLANLTSGGSDIPIAADGNYTITLNPWTLVGTATMN